MSAWEAVSRLCQELGYHPGEIRYGGRHRLLVQQRCEIAKRLRPYYSLPELAKGMGGRDHTTILYYLRREWPAPLPSMFHKAHIAEAGCGL